MGCDIPESQERYGKPQVEYATWSAEKLELLFARLCETIDTIHKPVLVVMETAHFKLPADEKNMLWAAQNSDFADRLAGGIIRRYGRSVRLLATLLINNLEEEHESLCEETVHRLFADKRYINLSALRVLSERNLKNRAYKALKNNSRLVDSFIQIDGKAYLRDEEYQHDLAAGFVDESGRIIPRCGLILTSFLDKVAALARERMFPHREFEVVFLSFCEEYHEYQRVKLGVDIYTSTHETLSVTPFVLHWDYSRDRCLISFRGRREKEWQDIEV
jgi:hypothetical protein